MRSSASKATALTAENKRARLGWAKSHANTDWKRIWSFDEAYFNLDESRGPACHTNRTQHRALKRRLTTKQQKMSVGIAVAISHNRKSALCFLNGNWSPRDLLALLRDQLLPSIEWDPTQRRCRAFLIDNDGRHHNRELKAFMEENGMLRVNFQPSNSPDLNPIENVFHIMKESVRVDAPSTEDELRRSVVKAWETLSADTLRSLFDSMPRRMQQVVDCNGDRIPY